MNGLSRRFVVCGALCLTMCVSAHSQDLQLDRGATGTFLRLKQLQTIGSVLHVVAHPDDEDGAMLAYCARGIGCRTMLFSITRGEGGANLISSDFFDNLGALRTLEHLKAASYYGNQLFYSRAADYGYSKTLNEAKRQWEDGLPILEDLVEVIRRERPTVMLSRFAGDPRDGHGHHQMAGVLSRVAFKAAADPSQFPHQLQRGLLPWQVKKLYVRARSRSDEGDSSVISLPTGEYDPIIGRSYSQVARFGLGFQRSQGIWGHEGEPGPRYSYYRLADSSELDPQHDGEHSVFDGCDVSLSGMVDRTDSGVSKKTKQQLKDIERHLADLFGNWNPADPNTTVLALSKQLRRLRELNVFDEERKTQSDAILRNGLRRLDRDVQHAIVSAAGLQIDAWVTDTRGGSVNHATSGDEFTVHVRIANQNPALSAEIQQIAVLIPGGEVELHPDNPDLDPASVLEERTAITLQDVVPTRPYWRRDSIAQPLYQVDLNGQQAPLPDVPFQVAATVLLQGNPIELKTDLRVNQRHPEFGEVRYPLTVAPALNVRFSTDGGVIPKGDTEYKLSVIVQSCGGGEQGAQVMLEVPHGWSTSPARHELLFQREDEERTVDFVVNVPTEAESQRFSIAAVAMHGGKEFREGFDTVSARDLGRLNVYRDAIHHVRIANVDLLGRPNVAYIPGSGDEVANSLATLGITPRTLSKSDLASSDLARFDVILVGVRAYAVREDIRKYNSRLLDYVDQGGVLIVQYQTPEFDQDFGPFPYKMGRRPEEVSEEDAVVTILEPQHPVFVKPNRITPGDFDGWYEQRGSKFWTTWDDRYTPLLECHDAGQAPQEGGMLIARSGKGLYVYSAYAWYRQLPNGVPGAYRLFANMLSLPQTARTE